MNFQNSHDESLVEWLKASSAAPSQTLLALGQKVQESNKPADLRAILQLLYALHVDEETICAAIAYRLPEEQLLSISLPVAVQAMVEGQREAEKIWLLHAEGGAAEGLRRLLLALIGDLRVLFILLAQHLTQMRESKQAEQRQRLAKLATDIHAPLASRLGIWQIKWELEDLAFQFLQPENFAKVQALLDERRSDRERFIANASSLLHSALSAAGIKADIAGRPKHIFSIWKKMQRKGVEFEHLYDIRAIRLMVSDVATCYAALGVVHGLWPNIPGEFDDYIARPKGNLYRSLHTAVEGPEGKTLEVQIRTAEMHSHAELGVAAHWRYKEGGKGDAAFERKIAAMRQLLESRDELDDAPQTGAQNASAITDDRVYVLTPQARVVDMPAGATVLDFAYHVHSAVGHRCRGAKANGRIVPLSYQPQSGETVEILTGKLQEPHRDWLQASNAYLATGKAREKVRSWFRKLDHEKNLHAGKDMFDRELKKLGLGQVSLESLPSRFHLGNLDDIYIAVGTGDITLGQVSRVLHEIAQPKTDNKPLSSIDPPKPRKRQSAGLVIEGVGNLLTTTARCCQPVPGDEISGYLTRGRGVSIHRISCRSLRGLAARQPERVVPAEWGNQSSRGFEVDILVRAFDRKGLLKDASAAITSANLQVLGASTHVDPDRSECNMHFALRVNDFEQLSVLLTRLAALPNVVEARRMSASEFGLLGGKKRKGRKPP